MKILRNNLGIGQIAALIIVSLALLCGCASIGTPEGGPRDYTPPVAVKSTPNPGTTNFKGKKVELAFNEIITLKDQQNKVVVSPAPKTQPKIWALGKKITVEFQDELEPNTTYVIDFTDAIEDNNEGNVLDGFSFAFSTGESIDTLQVSGVVLRACDLEPMKNVLVGLHSELDDSAFTTIPLERVTRTNDRGEFTVRNIKAGRYHAFAIKDLDGNYKMARNEDYAFSDDILVPSVGTYTSQDTVFTFDQRIDTITTGTHIKYLPNDVLLCLFNEDYKSHYLVRHERQDSNRLHIKLSAPAQELPHVEIVEPSSHRSQWCVEEFNEGKDSLIYWLTDPAMIHADTVRLAVTYLRTDSTDQLVHATDTLNFVQKGAAQKRKQMEKEQKEREKRQEKIMKLEERLQKLAAEGKDTVNVWEELRELREANTIKPQLLKLEVTNGDTGVDDSLSVKCNVPLAHIDLGGVHLKMMNPTDSTWSEVTVPPFATTGTLNLSRMVSPVKFTPGAEYELTLDSLAVQSIYGNGNGRIVNKLRIKRLDQYSNLEITVHNASGSAFVELLDASDKPVRRTEVKEGKVHFANVEPGTYYARLTLDANSNGKWDPGNYAKHLQPEEVYYLPQKIRLRENFNVELAWNIYEVAINRQKPNEVKKNKPDLDRGPLNKKKPDKKGKNDEEEDDEFNSNAFKNGVYSGDRYKDYHNN